MLFDECKHTRNELSLAGRQWHSSTLLLEILLYFCKIKSFEYPSLDVANHQVIKPTIRYLVAQLSLDNLHG
jgi:hypothetical protein